MMQRTGRHARRRLAVPSHRAVQKLIDGAIQGKGWASPARPTATAVADPMDSINLTASTASTTSTASRTASRSSSPLTPSSFSSLAPRVHPSRSLSAPSSRALSAVAALGQMAASAETVRPFEVGQVDPFLLVADELAGLAERMRGMILTEIPKLASAADYFFRVGAQGKRFRPTVILLMASSLERCQLASHPIAVPMAATGGQHRTVSNTAAAAAMNLSSPTAAMQLPSPAAAAAVLEGQFSDSERRERQRRIAEITEMIHVASLLHDDVLDHADTRRGVSSLNYMMGNKLAVLAGDFLLARASAALAALRNTEVVELLSAVLEHLVGGEVMQMVADTQQCASMDYYLHKSFLKTASLLAHSCKAVAVLGGQGGDTAQLAYEYGRHLGLSFQLMDDALDFTGSLTSLGKPPLNDIKQGLITAPVLFACDQHLGMRQLMERKFKGQGDVEQAVAWVRSSGGVSRTRALAAKHSALAVQAVQAMPPAESADAARCRQGLIELTQIVLSRSK